MLSASETATTSGYGCALSASGEEMYTSSYLAMILREGRTPVITKPEIGT
jgi:hypothetical protein